MDMSAEHKCSDLGGVCEDAKYFYIKCVTELYKDTFFWRGGGDYGHAYQGAWCVIGGGR